MLLEDGMPVHIVSRMLGHACPSHTPDIYGHAIDTGGDVEGARLTALLASHAVNDDRRLSKVAGLEESRRPSPSGGIQAAFAYSDRPLPNTPNEMITKKLALAIPGRTAP